MTAYDTIVVGAGPAGASAAYWLGEAGQRVLVLEKEPLPRYKACGGAVPQPVFDDFPFDLSSTIERRVRRVRFRYADGRAVGSALTGGAVMMVMRDRFDAAILRRARATVEDGVAMTDLRQDGTGVEVDVTSGKTYRARTVVGADGAHSRVARAVGLRTEKVMGVALEAEVPVDDSLLETYADTAVFIFGASALGYQWVFPKADHLSVGAGQFAADASAMRQKLESQMGRLGITLDGAPQRGHPLPIYRDHERLSEGRVVLVGDAAGLMDPLLGEGIRHAIRSGKLGAQAILAEDLAGYSRVIHREIGQDFRWARLWAHAFFHHPRASFELAVRNRWFVRQFVRLLNGETTYRAMAVGAPLQLALGWPKRLSVA